MAQLLTEYTDKNCEVTCTAEFKNYLYFGMKNGQLNRFDGTAFSLIKTFSQSIKTLKSDEKYLYIGFGAGEEFYYYDGSTFYSSDLPDKLASTTITNVQATYVAPPEPPTAITVTSVVWSGTNTFDFTFNVPVTAVDDVDENVEIYDGTTGTWVSTEGASQVSSNVVRIVNQGDFNNNPTLWGIWDSVIAIVVFDFPTGDEYTLSLPQQGSVSKIEVLVTSVVQVGGAGSDFFDFTFNYDVTAVDDVDDFVQISEGVGWYSTAGATQVSSNVVRIEITDFVGAATAWDINGVPTVFSVPANYHIGLQSGTVS